MNLSNNEGEHIQLKRMKNLEKKKEKVKEIKAQLLRKLKGLGMGSFELESLETICRMIINKTLKQKK